MQVELLCFNDHWGLHVLVSIDPGALLRNLVVRVRVHILSGHHVLMVIVPGRLQSVRCGRPTHGEVRLVHLAAARYLLLLLLRVVVLNVHDLLEGLVIFRTLLPQDLVHVARGTVDYRGLRDAVGSTATLGTGALTRLMSLYWAALFHRFLAEFEVHIGQVSLAGVD